MAIETANGFRYMTFHEYCKYAALTNEGNAFGVDDSAWEKMKVVCLSVYYHRVASIVTPLPINKETALTSLRNIAR